MCASLMAGCQRPQTVDAFPAGAIPVRYVPADDPTDCLAASVVMSANYVLGHDQFTTKKMRQELRGAGMDPSRTADVRSWLESYDLYLTPLVGELTDKPPLGLVWWVQKRGYPMVCVINRHAGDSAYNHAVVVIGFEFDAGSPQSATVHVLDPASPRRLESWERDVFDHYWASAGRVMMPIYEAPRMVAGPEPAVRKDRSK